MCPARVNRDEKVIATQSSNCYFNGLEVAQDPLCNVNITGQTKKKESWGPDGRRQDVTSDWGLVSRFLGAPE